MPGRQDIAYVGTMEIQGLREEWSIIRVCLKWKWPALNGRDLSMECTSVEDLLDRLQRKTGESRESLIETIMGYSSTLKGK